MKFLYKYKNELVISLLLIGLYLIFRLIFLDRLPIFTDEAIYMRWAQIALNDASWRFISLTDGKQPMFVWVAMFFVKFVSDPLIAGRLVSVISGSFTMIGLWFLTFELFKSKRTAFLTCAIYIFFPFAQVLDRMALYDSMVAAFSVWSLYFSILLVRKLRLDLAYTLGFIIGGGVLTKSSNFFSIYLLPLTLLLFDFGDKSMTNKLFKWIRLSFFSSLIAFGLYNVLRLSPLFEMVSAKNSTFVFPFFEWINHPLYYFQSNLSGLFSWLLQYLGASYIALIILSLILIKQFVKEKLLLLIYFFLPFLALALFGKLIYPRFIFFMVVMLLPIVAWGLNFTVTFLEAKLRVSKRSFYNNLYILVVTFFFIFYPALVSLQFAIDPVNAKIADADRSQYVNSWAAGWGVKESVNFFKSQSQNQKIFVATEGTFGLMPESLEMYLVRDKNIKIKGYWPVDIFPTEVLDYASKMPTYFVFYQPQHIVLPATYPKMQLVFQVRQGNTKNFYRVYKVANQK